ncbi:MAG TPA: glycosyltransferase family 39 protein [Candidatus Levybacteria bacterium]|nr:glycosyltransferase family 39 protein [Candidatus Levybacteria bacterium]
MKLPNRYGRDSILDKNFFIFLFLFCILNGALFFSIILFSNKIPFEKENYYINSHHYFIDPQASGGSFNFLRALGQYDAQWYLKIATVGYPNNPVNTNIKDKSVMDGLTWAFFPLYPLTLFLINLSVGEIEVSAFLLANILMLANFFSMYFVVSKIYGKNLALKTIFLLFFFPFSIFYRSYFTEGLLLFEIIWFSYFLTKKTWLPASVVLAAAMITRGTGLFLFPIFIFFLLNQKKRYAVKYKKVIEYTLIAFVPFLVWILFNLRETGDPVYFLHIRSAWNGLSTFSIINNLSTVLISPFLPIHSFHWSKIDVLVFLFTFIILIKGKKTIRPEFWYIAFALWIGPFLTTDTMSYARYQIISFPVFLYLAQILKGFRYIVVLFLFACGLFFTSLLFVNWYWIG